MTEIQTKQDLHDLPNGAVLDFQDHELLKIKTDKDRYGSEQGIIVLDEQGEQRKIHPIHDGVVLVDENAAFITGDPHDPSTITYLETDKERLKQYLNTLY